MAIGAYLNVQYPDLNPKTAAVGAYLLFMALNILGVKLAAMFELVVTVLAVLELLVFMGVVSPGFSVANFAANGWAGSDHFGMPALSGIFAAIPFAIWFSSPLKARRWRPKKPKIRSAPSRKPTSAAFLPGGAGDWRDAAGRRRGRLAQAVGHQRSAAAGDEDDRWGAL